MQGRDAAGVGHLDYLADVMAAGQVVQNDKGQDVQGHGGQLAQGLYDGPYLVGVCLYLHTSRMLSQCELLKAQSRWREVSSHWQQLCMTCSDLINGSKVI